MWAFPSVLGLNGVGIVSNLHWSRQVELECVLRHGGWHIRRHNQQEPHSSIERGLGCWAFSGPVKYTQTTSSLQLCGAKCTIVLSLISDHSTIVIVERCLLRYAVGTSEVPEGRPLVQSHAPGFSRVALRRRMPVDPDTSSIIAFQVSRWPSSVCLPRVTSISETIAFVHYCWPLTVRDLSWAHPTGTLFPVSQRENIY